jgi:hypothetical protein
MRKPRQQGSSSIGPEAEARGPARGLSRKSTREASSNLVGGGKIRCAIYTVNAHRKGTLDVRRKGTPVKGLEGLSHDTRNWIPCLTKNGALLS